MRLPSSLFYVLPLIKVEAGRFLFVPLAGCSSILCSAAFVFSCRQVVDNILSNPADVKFRELRANNKTIQRAVLGCHGGREFLSLLGFEK